jgi:tRNA modification GTPase
MEFAGYPAILMDTAGIRESSDDIESEGIRRALARAESADIKLLLFEGESPDADTAQLIDERTILVATKCDLHSIPHSPPVISLSTQTGQGVDALLKVIETRIIESFSGEGAMITRSRHRSALNEAEAHLLRFHNPLPLILWKNTLGISSASLRGSRNNGKPWHGEIDGR